MYVTRRLSQLLKSPESLSELPESPNSGYLVIEDEESERYYYDYSWLGRRRKTKDPYLCELPFPQNRGLIVGSESKNDSCSNQVFLIPVLDQPLSSNRYYVIDHEMHQGKAFICSTEDDKVTCCFGCCSEDVEPRPLDPHNIYQQFEIFPSQGRNSCQFFAKCVAPDCSPPYFLQKDRWSIHTYTPNFKLDTAQGLDPELRARLPEFNFPVSCKSSKPCVVGKWYTPFAFVKEGKLRAQVERSMYYELTLEQRWERIFTCPKNTSYDDKQVNSVVIDTTIEKEEVFIGGSKSKAAWSEKDVDVDGVIWFTSKGDGGKRIGVGLRVELVERMKWEQKRGGFIDGEERQVKINRVAKFKNFGGGWIDFGCYILVESFNLRRMDGSVVMSYDFKHFDQMKAKWEGIKYA